MKWRCFVLVLSLLAAPAGWSTDLQGRLKAVHPHSGDMFTPADVKVLLIEPDGGNVVARAWTDDDGYYFFRDVEPGDYLLEIAVSGDDEQRRRRVRVERIDRQSIETITLAE